MKALKILAWVVGSIAVLVAVLLILALTPGVQTWAVRKAVAGQPGMTVELDRVAAGFSSAEISNLRYAKDGIVVTAKAVTAKYSAWDYITKSRVNADQVLVKDLVVDLRNPAPAAKPAPGGTTGTGGQAEPAPRAPKQTPASAEKKPPFEGVLKQAQLPMDLRVANLNVTGRALLPDQQDVSFELKGSGIETGQRGRIEWTVDFADAKKAAALQALRTTGNASVHIAADRRIDLVEVDVVAAAMGPKLPQDRVRLVAKLDQPSPGGNEGYSASVALLRGNNTDTLFKTNAQWVTAAKEIAGAWEISIRSEQLAAVLAGLGLPELAANGSGKFSVKPDTNAVSASGDLHGQASQLAKLSPALEAVGAVNFKTTFDGGLADQVARLDKLNLEVTGLDGRKFAQITALQKVTYNLNDKRVTLANPRAEVANISLQAVPLAWAQPVAKPMAIESGDLSLSLAVEAEPDGSRIRVRAAEPLALRTVTVRGADKKLLADRVTLTVRPTIDYTATRITAELADLNVSMPSGDALTGKLAADVTNFATKPVIVFSSQIQGKVVGLIKGALPFDPGPLAVNVSVEGKQEGDFVDLAKATTVVNREGGALLNSTELLQAMRANLKTNAISVPKPNESAMRVRVGEVPLQWAEAFVANSKFAGTLAGMTMEVAVRSLDDMTVNTTSPATGRGATVAMDGKPMVNGLDVTADFTATKRGETIQYDVRRVEVKQGQTALASLNATGQAKLGAKMTVSAKGKLDADAAALMKQPVAAPFATLNRGQIAATFEASMADATEAKAVLSVKNLVAKQDNRALGDIDATVTAAMKADGSGTVVLPLTLTNGGRKSDVSVNGAFGKAADQKTFLLTGKVSSNQIIVDDFQALAVLAPSGDQAKATPAATPSSPTVAGTPPSSAPRTTTQTPPTQTPSRTTPPPVASTPGTAPSSQPGRDAEPFWNGVNGKLDVDLKRVLYGKDYVISGIKGGAVITNTRLALDGLEGRLKENPFKLAAGINFVATQPKPYTLTGLAEVNNFDVGELLRAANPNEKPSLESKVSLNAKLNGNGGTVADLAKNVYGVFDLRGSSGVLRALGRKGQTAVNVGSAIIGLIGAARGSNTTMAVADLAAHMNELKFDQFTMRVERGVDLNFKASTVEFISPIMRLTGTGALDNKGNPDLPIENQPMRFDLQLAAKEEFALLLNKAGMLVNKQDEKGYYLMSQTFSIGGTPAKPDSSSLWQMIGAAAAKAAAGALLK